MPRRLHSWHRLFSRRRADAQKKDRYITGSALFCTGVSGYSLVSSWRERWKERNHRLRIEEYRRTTEQLIQWCNYLDHTYVTKEQGRVRRQALVEERLIQLGVLKGWELIQVEEDQDDEDEEEPGVADEGKDTVQVQSKEKAQTDVDGGSGIGERGQSEFVVGRDDEETMNNENGGIKGGSSSWFIALLSIFTSKKAPIE